MSDLPFDRKALIRDLPELLAGPEPILAQPKAKEFIAQDPEARGLILAAAETAVALDEGMSRMRRTRPFAVPALKRPMEQVKKHFARRMVDVLFDAALAVYAEATAELGYFIECVHDTKRRTRTPAELDNVAKNISDHLGLRVCSPHESDKFTGPAEAHDARTRWRELFRLLDSCDALTPGRDVIVMTRAQALCWTGAEIDQDWFGIAARFESSNVNYFSFLQAADSAARRGDYAHACELASVSRRYGPSSLSATQRTVLFAQLAGNRGALRESQMQMLLLLAGAGRQLLARHVAADAHLWKSALLRKDAWRSMIDSDVREFVESVTQESSQ